MVFSDYVTNAKRGQMSTYVPPGDPNHEAWVKAWLQEQIAADHVGQIRRARPWVRDIIAVLFRRPNGLTNQQLYEELRSLRPTLLPKPREFEAAICSALNRHNSRSSCWTGKEIDALFYKPKGRGTWAVHRDRVKPWLEANGLSDV
jgi:hypothetical protein